MLSPILRTTHKSELPAFTPEASRYSCAVVKGMSGEGGWQSGRGTNHCDSDCADLDRAGKPSNPRTFTSARQDRLAAETFIP